MERGNVQKLQEELRDRGLTMERYGLVPASSTISAFSGAS